MQSVISGYQDNLEEMSEKVSDQQKDLQEMKIQLEKAIAELTSSRFALSNVTNTLQTTLRQRDCLQTRSQISIQI